MSRHNQSKVHHTFELLKNLADLAIGVQLLGISKRMLKHDLGESAIGIAGSVSAAIGVC